MKKNDELGTVWVYNGDIDYLSYMWYDRKEDKYIDIENTTYEKYNGDEYRHVMFVYKRSLKAAKRFFKNHKEELGKENLDVQYRVDTKKGKEIWYHLNGKYRR